MQAKLLLSNLCAGILALAPMAAFAECANVESLVQREARLESHVERGAMNGYLTQNESIKFKRKLGHMREVLSWHQERRCLTLMDNRQINDELTRVSVQLFRALHRGESRASGRQLAQRR
jgi:hypothetical protein